MTVRQNRRFWTEIALGAASGAGAILTLVVPDWIEAVFGVDPDRSSGALEWLFVVVLVAATLVFASLARREWRRPAFEASG
jgi:hypothetical protein